MSAGSKTNPGGYVVDPQSWNNLKSVTNDRLQRLQKSFPVKDMNPFGKTGIKYTVKCHKVFMSKELNLNFLSSFVFKLNQNRCYSGFSTCK
jgi:hypothetical protein